MENPSRVSQPSLSSPVGGRPPRHDLSKNRTTTRITGKGNLPYLRFRRKLRKGMWG